MSGAQAPVVRAWWMFALWAGHWFYAPLRGGLLALMLTAVGLLLYDGAILFSASAWLSFYATAVVIVLYRRYHRRRPLAIWWRVQLGLTLALLPLGWAIFGGVSVVGFGGEFVIGAVVGCGVVYGVFGLGVGVGGALGGCDDGVVFADDVVFCAVGMELYCAALAA